MTTPVRDLRSHYLTVSAPTRRSCCTSRQPIHGRLATGRPGAQLQRHVLPPRATHRDSAAHRGAAGTMFVSAAPRAWESSRTARRQLVPGGRARRPRSRTPSPGTKIKPTHADHADVLEAGLRRCSGIAPAAGVAGDARAAGSTLNAHTIAVRPEGYGYGLGADCQARACRAASASSAATAAADRGQLDRAARLDARACSSCSRSSATCRSISTTPAPRPRLAGSGRGGCGDRIPPKGTSAGATRNTPAPLKRGMWSPGTYSELTKGAVMAFEDNAGHDRRRRRRPRRLEGADQRGRQPTRSRPSATRS